MLINTISHCSVCKQMSRDSCHLYQTLNLQGCLVLMLIGDSRQIKNKKKWHRIHSKNAYLYPRRGSSMYFKRSPQKMHELSHTIYCMPEHQTLIQECSLADQERRTQLLFNPPPYQATWPKHVDEDTGLFHTILAVGCGGL